MDDELTSRMVQMSLAHHRRSRTNGRSELSSCHVSRRGWVALLAIALVAVTLNAAIAAAASADSAVDMTPASLAIASSSPAPVPLELFVPMSNLTEAEMDPLIDVGVSHGIKMRLWSTYVILNAIGCILCATLIISVMRLRSRSSSDVLVAALCFSCLCMSFSCGVQCALNLAKREFAFGRPACYWEAMCHLTSILTMFGTLSLMAFDSWRTVKSGKGMSETTALIALATMWTAAAGGLGIASIWSPIYMADTGVFCFFAFDSPLMFGFVFPIFAVAGTITVVSYSKIWVITRLALQRVQSAQTSASSSSAADTRSKMQLRLAQKLFALVLIFLVSWLVLLLGIFVKLATGKLMNLDAIGGVSGVLHTSWVPLAHLVINPRLRKAWVENWTCGLIKTAAHDSHTGANERPRGATGTTEGSVLSVDAGARGAQGTPVQKHDSKNGSGKGSGHKNLGIQMTQLEPSTSGRADGTASSPLVHSVNNRVHAAQVSPVIMPRAGVYLRDRAGPDDLLSPPSPGPVRKHSAAGAGAAAAAGASAQQPRVAMLRTSGSSASSSSQPSSPGALGGGQGQGHRASSRAVHSSVVVVRVSTPEVATRESDVLLPCPTSPFTPSHVEPLPPSFALPPQALPGSVAVAINAGDEDAASPQPAMQQQQTLSPTTDDMGAADEAPQTLAAWPAHH